MSKHRVKAHENRRVLGILAITVGMGLVLGGVALGAVTDNMYKTDNYNPDCQDGGVGDTFCQTDNDYVTAHRQSSLSSTGNQNIYDTLIGSYDTTDLEVHFDSTPEYSGSAETDIIYQQSSSLPGSLIGIAWCNDAVGTGPTALKCDQHYVRFKSSSPDRALACHETGHAVGLTHGDDADPRLSDNDSRLGCMIRPHDADNKYLLDNNTDNINSTY